MSGRNSQVSRIYVVLGLLESARLGLSVAEITALLQERGFEIAKRTVYRDLEALLAAGFPLTEQGKNEELGTRWTLEHNTRIQQHLVLSSRELFALYLARSVLIPLKETPFFADLQTVFQKIEDRLGSKSLGELHEVSTDFHFEPGPRWGLGIDPDVVETIRAACTERQVLLVNYSSVSSGLTRDRKVGPQFLYFAKGSLYLVAEDCENGTVKVFSIPRINSATMLDEEYNGKAIDPEQFFSSSIGVYVGGQPLHSRIRFGPNVANFVKERRWHSTQRVISKEGGWIEVELEVAQTPELIQWVLGFGCQALVIEPASLADAVAAEARLTSDLYTTLKAS